MRWQLPTLAAFALALTAATLALAQADPNQPAPDPQAIIQQLRDNMNNAGVTPRDLIQQVGQGTTFRLKLPLNPVLRADQTHAPSRAG